MTEATSSYLNLPLRTEDEARLDVWRGKMAREHPNLDREYPILAMADKFIMESTAGGLRLYPHQEKALEMIMSNAGWKFLP